MTRSRILKVVAVVLLAGAAVYFYPPLRLGALVMLGRSPVCPFSQAVKSGENLRRQIEIKDAILKGTRLVEKDPGGFDLWDTPKGRFWFPKGGDYVLPFELAEQERKIYGTGEQAVRPGDTVLDCGASVGEFTREALNAGAKLVVAIELSPEGLECLRRNFVDEVKDGRVIVYPKGVWDRDDFLTLNVAPQNSAADSVVIQPKGSHEGPKVPLTTIDKLVAELKLERVDYIKMDIEGAEQRALAGARATIAKYKPRLSISAYHRPDDPEKIPAVIRRAWSGYRMECGPCAQANWGIRPDVLYFR
jgi:FkbM family methyltransferase